MLTAQHIWLPRHLQCPWLLCLMFETLAYLHNENQYFIVAFIYIFLTSEHLLKLFLATALLFLVPAPYMPLGRQSLRESGDPTAAKCLSHHIISRCVVNMTYHC